MPDESWWAKVRETLPMSEVVLAHIEACAEAAIRRHVRYSYSPTLPREYRYATLESESNGEWKVESYSLVDVKTRDTIACARAVYPEGASDIEPADARFMVTADPATVRRLVEEIRRLRLIAREMVERCDGYPATPVADACLFCGHFEEEPEKHAPGCPWPLLLLSLPPERT